MMGIAGIPIIVNDQMVDTIATEKRWKRRHTIDKVRRRVRVVPKMTIYQTKEGLIMHPQVAHELQKATR